MGRCSCCFSVWRLYTSAGGGRNDLSLEHVLLDRRHRGEKAFERRMLCLERRADGAHLLECLLKLGFQFVDFVGKGVLSSFHFGVLLGDVGK